jgi:hypothetical protein
LNSSIPEPELKSIEIFPGVPKSFVMLIAELEGSDQ